MTGKCVRHLWTVLALLVSGCGSFESAGSGERALAAIKFQTFQRRTTPNDFLVCPRDYCRAAVPDMVAGSYPLPASAAYKQIMKVLEAVPRTRIVAETSRRIQVEQRSLVFGFPDDIDIELIEVSENASTIAIYSRSKYGYFDFGANEQRARKWLDAFAPLFRRAKELDKFFMRKYR